MNQNIYNALNGVAIAAANAKDMNTVSVMQQVLNDVLEIGTAYDGASTSATVFLNQTMSPYNGIQFDAVASTAKQTGLTGKQLGA